MNNPPENSMYPSFDPPVINTPQPLIEEPLIPNQQVENLNPQPQNVVKTSKFFCISGVIYGIFSLVGLILIDFTGILDKFHIYSNIFINSSLIASLVAFSSIASFAIAFFVIALGGNCWKTLKNENEQSIKWNLRVIRVCFLTFLILFGLKSLFNFFIVNSLSKDLEIQIDKIPPYIIYLQHKAEQMGEFVPNFVFEYQSGKVIGNHTFSDCSFLYPKMDYSPIPPFERVMVLHTFLICRNDYPFKYRPEITTSMSSLLVIMRPGMLTMYLVHMLLTFIGIFLSFIIFVAANRFLKKSKNGFCCNCQQKSQDIIPEEIK